MTAERRGLAAAIGGGALWGTIGIFNTWLFAYGLDPTTVVTIRIAFAWLIFGLVIACTDRRLFRVNRRDLPLLAAAGVLSVAAFSFLYATTVEQSSVATAVVLQFMAPVYVVFIGAVVFRERVTAAKLIALALALIGAVLSVGGFRSGALLITPLGLAAGIAAGVTYAMYSLLGKAAAQRYQPWTVLFYTYGFGGLAMFALWLPTHPGGASLPPLAWLLEFGLALLPTVIGYWLYNYALHHIEAGRAALACTSEPVAGVILAALILGERPTLSQILGGLAILAAVAVVSVAAQARPTSDQARSAPGRS
ncbi:MAG: DMT family transporter [Chloroflexota bacterium]